LVSTHSFSKLLGYRPFRHQLEMVLRQFQMPSDTHKVDQVVCTQSKVVHISNLFYPIPYANAVSVASVGGQTYLAVLASADFSMQAAILSGLSSDKNTLTQETPVRCPSGNCEWPPYTSLAVCSACSDITSSLVKTTKNYTTSAPYSDQYLDFSPSNPSTAFRAGIVNAYTLPNALHLDFAPGMADVSAVFYGTSNRTRTVVFKDNNEMLWSSSMIKNETSANGPELFTATECALYYCVKEYTSQVKNGSLIEISRITPSKQSTDSMQPVDAKRPPVRMDGQLNSPSDYASTDLHLGDNFRVSQVAINGIAAQMAKTFNLDPAIRNATGYYYVTSAEQFAPPASEVLYKSTNLTLTFENLAQSVSSNMRVKADDSTVVEGTTGIVVYKIRWSWISLPAVSVMGSWIFLALAIYQTKVANVPIWKTSPLAILKYGAQAGPLLEEEQHVSGMEDKAKKTYISSNDLAQGKQFPSSVFDLNIDQVLQVVWSIWRTEVVLTRNHDLLSKIGKWLLKAKAHLEHKAIHTNNFKKIFDFQCLLY
jgi:hypothetical protein